MKKLVSMILTLVLVLSMAVPAMAADESYTIKIKNSSAAHTYEAYQIFQGDFDKDDSTVPPTWTISNAQWGNGINDAGKAHFGNAETMAESLTDEAAAKAFAVRLIPYLVVDNAKTSGTYNSSEKTYTIGDLDPGYYLIKDMDNSLTGDESSYTAYIMKVAENTEITPKAAKPSSYKKVMDASDSFANVNDGKWIDSADHDMGDQVPFQLTGTLPSNFTEYLNYTMVFHDEQSAGLTFNPASVKVYVNHLEDRHLVSSGYTIKTKSTEDEFASCACSNANCTFEIEIPNVRNLKDAAGEHINVNANTLIEVEYTSELNTGAEIGAVGNPNEMYMEYSNNPNQTSGGELGKTKKDKVIVFTYKTIINKVKENHDALEGADFKLEKKMLDGTWVEVNKNIVKTPAVNPTTFEFRGLDDGYYRITESATPDGFNSIDPFCFEIIAQHNDSSENPALILLHSNQITETGANVTDNIIFSATVDLTAGSITSDIVNKAGATLPETGGMGTTLFYIVGAILVIGAGVTLIARKRMNK